MDYWRNNDERDKIYQEIFNYCVFDCIQCTSQKSWVHLEEPYNLLKGILKQSIHLNEPGNEDKAQLVLIMFSLLKLVKQGLEDWGYDSVIDSHEEFCTIELINELFYSLNYFHVSFNLGPEVVEAARKSLLYTYLFVLQLCTALDSPVHSKEELNNIYSHSATRLRDLINMKSRTEKKILKSLDNQDMLLDINAPHPKQLIHKITSLIQKIAKFFETPVLLKVPECKDILKEKLKFKKEEAINTASDNLPSSKYEKSLLLGRMDVKYADVKKMEVIKAGEVGCADTKTPSSCQGMMNPDAKIASTSTVSATLQMSTALPDFTSLLLQDLQKPAPINFSTSTSVPTQKDPSNLIDGTSPMDQGLSIPVSVIVSTVSASNVADSTNPFHQGLSVPIPVNPSTSTSLVPKQVNATNLPDRASLLDQSVPVHVSVIATTTTSMPKQVNATDFPNRASPMDQGLPRSVSYTVSTSRSTTPPQLEQLEINSSRQGRLMLFERYHANQFPPARKRPLMVTDVDLEVDLQFFQGLLPSVDELLIRNKRRFKQAVSNLLFDMLEDQAQECDI
ncbi:uncharacterized protein LOC131944761 [Physella acuta]|uniref:uncharacterized protein LOC131944761 n=1 Tax=Physella acuta TaxID=109671 RepID=UPI0027DB9C59|nr:uncharacterized protein LOC131944761 [Physella acuta]